MTQRKHNIYTKIRTDKQAFNFELDDIVLKIRITKNVFFSKYQKAKIMNLKASRRVEPPIEKTSKNFRNCQHICKKTLEKMRNMAKSSW